MGERRDGIGQGDTAQACANCGALISGPYCPQCGQARAGLDRPLLVLLQETLDGFLSWDGRFWRTVRAAYLQPGKPARDYAAGKRARHTPPVRLYLIGLFVFFALMQAGGVTVLSVEIEPVGDSPSAPRAAEASIGGVKVALGFFRPPWEPAPEPITLEAYNPSANGVLEPSPEPLAFLTVIAADPSGFERRANLALSQAILVIVAVFALLNAGFHPRAKLVVHAVHTLYFHAVFLPMLALAALACVYVAALSGLASGVLACAATLCVLAFCVVADRAVYGSSLAGATARVVVMGLIYVVCFVLVAASLVSLGAIV